MNGVFSQGIGYAVVPRRDGQQQLAMFGYIGL
jgi:hypothetical protein